MKKLLFSVCSALAILGCGGENVDELPLFKSGEVIYDCDGVDYGDDYTCGGKEYPKPSSSSQPMSSISGDIIENFYIDAYLNGIEDENLKVNCNVRTINLDYLINKVEIKLNNKVIFTQNIPNGSRNAVFEDEVYTFTGQENCDGNEFNVCAIVYVKDLSPIQGCATPRMKRRVEICNPPSSSSVSSSSIAVKAFSLVGSFTLNSNSGDRGIMLSIGATTDNLNTADIYFEAIGNDYKLRTTKSTVKIMDAPFDVYNGQLYSNIVSVPQSTAQFPINPFAQGAAEVPYSSSVYYLVRTGGNSGSEWTANDYLVLAVSEPTGTVNKSVEIKVWKVLN